MDNFVQLFDGMCDQTKELQTLSGSMSSSIKWIISSTGRYVFVRFNIDNLHSSTGFLANIHYGKEILYEIPKSYMQSRDIRELPFLDIF